MKELIVSISNLINSARITCTIKTNDGSVITNITDIDINDKGYMKVFNHKYGISLVYIDNIEDIHITKI